MKHTFKITLLIIAIFFISQIVGLSIVNKYIDHKTTSETGNLTYVNLPFGIERPPIEETNTIWYIVSAIIVGTGILLVLIKFNKKNLWKIWFMLAVTLTLTIAFSAFMKPAFALVLAIIFGIFKTFRPNVYMHNLSEIFIYGGLAAIFVPILNIKTGIILLLIISAYDMFAVWKAKHMIKMAKFQTESKIFAGLFIPYRKEGNIEVSERKKSSKRIMKKEVRSAILGGGDIGFPLMFAGVVMQDLMMKNFIFIGFLESLIVPVFAAIALLILMLKSKEGKFYPAMPFITIGCFFGYAIVFFFLH